MKKYIAIAFVLFTIHTNAQNSNLTNNATYGQRYIEQVNDNNRKPNAPSYNGGSNNSNQTGGSDAIFERGYWKNLEAQKVKARVDGIKFREMQEAENKKAAQNELEQRVRDNFEYNKELTQKKNLALATIVPIIANDGMSYTEAREVGEMQLYFARNNLTFPEEEYKTAAKNFSNFNNSLNAGKFEKLLDLLWNAQRYALSTTDCLNILKKKFPQKIDTLEKAELIMMSNYFGGYRPHFYNTSDPYYPKAIVEILSDNDVKILYKQFHYLENKYPSLALKMAGSCRYFLNPYYYEGLLKYDLLNKDDKAARFEANKKNLFSIHFPVTTNGENDKNVSQLIDWRLSGSVQWLERNFPDYLNNFTEADWVKIADVQGIPITYLFYAVRKYNDNKSSWENKYTALAVAINNKSSSKSDDGGRYEGEYKNGAKEGKGVEKYSNGDGYTGMFKNNMYDGKGTFLWKDGSKYDGEFKNDKREGKGTYKWTSGTSYTGNWKEGKMEGSGVRTYLDSSTYTGNFIKGDRQGFGTLTFKNNGSYVGSWMNDRKNGKGTYTSEKGTIFIGDFINDTLNGEGTVKFKNGNNYIGQFKNWMFYGKGTFIWIDGNEYSGEWKNNTRDGNGTMKYDNGNSYTGQWKNGQLEGTGTYTWKEGAVYVGGFLLSQKKGNGTIKWPNGNTYTGQWANDKRDGEGVFTKANGNKKKGTFKNGEDDVVKYYNIKGEEISKVDYEK